MLSSSRTFDRVLDSIPPWLHREAAAVPRPENPAAPLVRAPLASYIRAWPAAGNESSRRDVVLTPGFLTKVGSIRVERVPAHDFGDVDLSRAPVGVGHTTEGSFESALQKFESV